MFGLLLDFVWGFVDSLYSFFCSFVFNNPSFISINIKIIALNVLLLLVWRSYVRHRNDVQQRKKSTALKTRDMKQPLVTTRKSFRHLLPLRNPVKQKPQFLISKDPLHSTRSTFSPPKMHRKLNKMAPSPLGGKQSQLFATPGMDTRDETLDEVTWFGNESISTLTDKDTTKLQYKLANAELDDTCADTVGRPHVTKLTKNDLRTRFDNEPQKRQEIHQKMNVCYGEKRMQPSRKELVSVPLKELIRASRQNSSLRRYGKTESDSSPEKRVLLTADKDERKESSTRSYETRESGLSHPWLDRKMGTKRRVKKMKERKKTKTMKIKQKSRKTIEIACDPGLNKEDDVDPMLDCSDNQLPRLQSEASLFYKRDSWIWFSSEMKPSGEDFASRQRKFQSRDPRVAELAVEISRQEEMNRDIEKTAESLIDSSSASTAKLGDMSLRVACCDDSLGGKCGVMKRLPGRMHKLKPYNCSSSKVLTASPKSAQLSKQRHSVKYSTARLSSLARASLNRQFAGGQHQNMPTPKKRNLGKSVSPGPLLKSAKLLPSHYFRTRTDFSSSPDHSKHISRRPGSATPSSSPHTIYYYSPQGAKIIRRSPISGRYSPLYDNTTLISSAQCSTSSAGSHETSLHDFLFQEKSQSKIDKTDDLPRKLESRKRKHSRSPSKSPSSNKCSESSTKVTTDAKSSHHSNTSSSKKDRFSSLQDQPSNTRIHTKQTLNQIVTKSNLSSSENVKTWRKSPQLVLSTGESESDSVVKDRSGGHDTSYRQGLISKEVNTAVHRMLFDNEKSSSSYSPSSKSKHQCQDGIYSDEVRDPVDGCTERNETCNSQFVSSTISEGDFDQLSSKELSQAANVEQESSTKSDDGQNSDVCLRAVKVQSSLQLSQPVSKSNNCTQTKKQRLTNIYTRDYYLGKRVTTKTQQNSSKHNCALNGEAGSSRWKKTNIKWSKAVSLRLYSPYSTSKLALPKKHMYKYSRLKPKPCLKPARSSTQQKHARSTASYNNTSDQLMAGDTGSKKSMQNQSRCCLLPRQRRHNGNNLHVASLEELNVCPQNPYKITALRKSFSQTLDRTTPERQVNPAAIHAEIKVPLFHSKYNREQPELQVNRSKLTLAGSTNNSSSNIPYKSCKL